MSAPTRRRGAAALAAPAGLDAVDAPRVSLQRLPSPAAQELRRLAPELLAAHQRRPAAMHGSTSGPDRVTRISYRPHQLAIVVYDDLAIATRRTWHAYWRSVTPAGAGYPPLRDPAAVDGAPPRPRYGIACVAVASWTELAAWHTRPARRGGAVAEGQTTILDLLAA